MLRLPPALPSSVVAATDVAVVDGGFAADVVGRDSGAGSRQRCVWGGAAMGRWSERRMDQILPPPRALELLRVGVGAVRVCATGGTEEVVLEVVKTGPRCVCKRWAQE